MAISVLTQIPENTNFLQTTKFTFTFPQLPFLRYFGQTVSLPGVSTSEVMVPTPFSDTYRHGDKLNYDPLSLTFLVDEDIRVWEETYQWIASLTKPAKFGEFVKKFPDKYYDGILTVNTNANVPNLRIKFYNCHPTSLGTIQFATTDTPDLTPVCDLTVRYDRFEIERL
jgi:hypothetical protein